ncbi:MAG: hypothetical protein II943_02835 [Victivallales bacterium]|nr:hypothetical protein [Victivallales bacterium]
MYGKPFPVGGVEINQTRNRHSRKMPPSRTIPKRLPALLLAAALLLCLFAATEVVLLETGHECSGEDCPVCHLVQLAGDSLAMVKPPVPPTVASPAMLAQARPTRRFADAAASPNTLVHLKIRLNN